MRATSIAALPGSFLVIGALLVPAQQHAWPFGAWQRVPNGPVIAPRGDGWEAAGSVTPAFVAHNARVLIFYRAQDGSGVSRLGSAPSTGGILFPRRAEPVLSP